MRGLISFEHLEMDKKISVKAKALKEKSKLNLRFCVHDPENLIILSKRTNIFQRSHELWKNTCFECFFAEKHKTPYWELNLDQGGNWNVYRFERYRFPEPPQEEKKIQQLELEFLKKPDGFELQCHLDLADLGLEQKLLEVSLNCVIEWKSEKKSYFALKHCGNKPDFHLREAFVCNLE